LYSIKWWTGIGGVTGPILHFGVSAGLAFVFKLNPVITIICGLLPDMLDAPLAAFGIGGGRYIGHTLLFAAVVVGLFFLWRRRYGYAAFAGLASHLILDLNGFVPWLYPFKNYVFPDKKLSFYEWFKNYLDLTHAGYELLVIVILGIVIFIGWWLYKRHTQKEKKSTD
jgi:hypothetical protein